MYGFPSLWTVLLAFWPSLFCKGFQMSIRLSFIYSESRFIQGYFDQVTTWLLDARAASVFDINNRIKCNDTQQSTDKTTVESANQKFWWDGCSTVQGYSKLTKTFRPLYKRYLNSLSLKVQEESRELALLFAAGGL